MTTNKNLKSWIEIDSNSDFPIQNIPFGVFKTKLGGDARCASRIGDYVIDLSQLATLGYFDDLKMDVSVFFEEKLNSFMALGKEMTTAVRNRIAEVFSVENEDLQHNAENRALVLFKLEEVEMLLPVEIGDYTDFYSSIEHATNVGKMFRDPDNALLPNWKHIPVGYHGRSSSIVVSGTNIHRPKGQVKPNDAELPIFTASRLLDFELEMAFVTGGKSKLGDSISVAEADDYIFGMMIFNDLSARDIQKWEYVPLGPFLGKNFGSVLSPWIITMEALAPFRVAGPKQEPKVLPYLEFEGNRNYDINLEVLLQPENSTATKISHSNHKYLYWNMAQQLAHQTVNGCNINTGDLYASGTISGPSEDAYGSMLELSWGGKKTIKLDDGEERKFINDHDTIIMKAYAEKDGLRIGFGECVTKILPAK
ncbi:MAG: fumarylacetoacetase [Bacteroidetes bacterium]|nr:MAG: fumarylacetoacetase [Bacteroidota bacterium]